MREFYTEYSQKSVSNYDRYKNCKVLVDNDTKDVLLETREIEDIKLSAEDSYHTVQANEVCRLDLISYKYYDNPLLWWVIAQANDIYDPLTKPVVGDVLRIPSLIDMYGYKGILYE